VGEVGYAAALLLAAVFGWAGLAKFRTRDQTARTFRAFGLAAPDALAVGVPVTELVLAVGLVVVPGWAALGALAVLAGFTTVLVRAMRAGVDVGCGCFGTAKREPVSFVELIRNGLLATAAVAAAFAAFARTSAMAARSAAPILSSAMRVRRSISAAASTCAWATIWSASLRARSSMVAASAPACCAFCSYSARSASASARS